MPTTGSRDWAFLVGQIALLGEGSNRLSGTTMPAPLNVVAGAVALAGRASLRRTRTPVRSQPNFPDFPP